MIRAASPAAPAEGRGFTLESFGLYGLLALALLVRIPFIGADGFHNDVSTFESWSLTLNQYSTRDFFAHAGFADYPPGYFFVLWIVGHLYALLVHADPTYSALKTAVKLPAILMDLVDAYLIYTIVRRYASETAALVAAAIFAFDPAVIFISAYWGQVDSVAAGVTLTSVLLILRAHDAGERDAGWIVGAWAVLAYSILVKPPAAVLIPLYLAFVFTGGRAALARRAIATAYGIAASFALAYVAAVVFHAGLNPLEQFAWLLGRYEYASSVYPYTSVNAFNMYAIGMRFWVGDDQTFFGIRFLALGLFLLTLTIALAVTRYVRRKDVPAFLEAALLLSLGFFVLSTRMHERYVFNALAFAIPLAFYRRRYLYAAVALSVTLFANLAYSLQYLNVMDQHPPGVDAANMMPMLSVPLSLLNLSTFVYLGAMYLVPSLLDMREERWLTARVTRAGRTVRGWFAPIEGVAHMTPRDWQLATGLTVASFVLSLVNYWWPSEKIFDEIYYARAGEEYLTHANVNNFGVFEFTHPPLTKLLITLSMILFGGMAHGDNAAGWRFLNLVVGALMVLVTYCFAKRLLASTGFAAVAAALLLFDGFHYVQTRIATPEITVAFLALLTLYCFYRLWIASQVRVTARLTATLVQREAIYLAVGTFAAAVLAFVLTHGQTARASLLAFTYFELGAYLAVRLFTPRDAHAAAQPEVSFADGSRLVAGDFVSPAGTAVVNTGNYAADGLAIAYEPPATLRYETGLGDAVFTGDAAAATAAMRVRYAGDEARAIAPVDERVDGRSGLLWMFLLSISAGCLAASKWNGLFDFFVIWGSAALVISQPYWSRIANALRPGSSDRDARAVKPAVWGNPFGFSLDVLVAAMLFIGMTIYVLTYIPFFTLGKNLEDLIGLQQQMYWYHSNLKATHPYGSSWWQWPILQRPISYYYHDWRTGAAAQDNKACCVAEILALPNPLIWWTGLVSVPALAYFAWTERSKGFALLVAAYVFQWLPWILSPRIAFEYHFFPNLAIICIADAVLLQRLWALATPQTTWPRFAVYGYVAAAIAVFVFFYPITAGLHVTWATWDARMLHQIMQNHWV